MNKPKHPKPQHQFEVEAAMKRRPLERLMIKNRFVGRALKATGMLGLSLMLWPRFVAPYQWRVRRFPMPLLNLPASFEGYRVLHLSDLHTGRPSAAYLVDVLRHAQELKPNLILITGDIIDYCPRSLIDLPAVLKHLHAPDGGIAILGNHDYHEYSWRHVGERSAHRAIHKRMVRMIRNAGITLLQNAATQITHADGHLSIVGLDEMWVGRMDAKKAFTGIRNDHPIICLQHNPDGLETLEAYPWQWMLCGHTHGGQVNVPFLGPLYVPMKHRHWLRGMYPLPGGKTMYVTTGVGYSGPAVRMRCPPEVTLFTLTGNQVAPLSVNG